MSTNSINQESTNSRAISSGNDLPSGSIAVIFNDPIQPITTRISMLNDESEVVQSPATTTAKVLFLLASYTHFLYFTTLKAVYFMRYNIFYH